MYRPASNESTGSIEEVNGLECHIPEPGWIYDPFSEEMQFIGIHQRSEKPVEQYWVRQGYPDWFDEEYALEKKRQEVNEDYVSPVLEEWRREQWMYRLGGFWFMNDGEPTYITGLHWYYLEWFYIGIDNTDTGYPDYWDSDRRFFYFLQYSIEDPRSAGVLYLTKRREGKTQKSGAFGLEPATRMYYFKVGIQSKTEEDAGTVVFKDCIIRAFFKLPDHFKPTYDKVGGDKPKKKLSLQKTPGRGKKGADQDREELNSAIDWKSSKEGAYDGKKLGRLIRDEEFKTENVDVKERHRVTLFCIKDTNGRFKGKILVTSTCEEIKGKVQDYIDMTKDSDHINGRDPVTGRTKSGLYLYFLPGDEARNRDIYGKCNVEKNRDEIIAERAQHKDDPDGYNSLVRKDPLSLEEFFRVASKGSVYDQVKLHNRLDQVGWANLNLERGNFEWKNGDRDSKVIWNPNPEGRWVVNKGAIEAVRTKIRQHGGTFYPDPYSRCVIGADPFSHNKVQYGRGSNGAIAVFNKFDPHNPDFSYRFIALYKYRPKSVDILYEDAIKACVFFGCRALIENNKIGMVRYFEGRGYRKFLIKFKGRREPGIAGSTQSIGLLTEYTNAYINDYCDQVDFRDLLEDWIKFDPTDTTEYDCAMAAGWALVAEKDLKILIHEETNGEFVDVEKMFGKHKVPA